MQFKYTKTLINEGQTKKAELFLFGSIGYDIDGNYFAKELKYIALDMQITDITVLVNSIGGSVFEGYSILAAIQMLKEKGIYVKTLNVGVAYSMAGIICTCGTKGGRGIFDYATAMIHSPSFADKSDLTEDMQEALTRAQNSLVTILVNNTGLDQAKIEEYMLKDTYFGADELLSNGMADTIVKTSNQVDNNLAPLEKMAACATMYNSKSDNKDIINKNYEQMKRINAILNLNTEASEQAQVEAIEKLQADAAKAVTLQAELTKYQNQVKALQIDNKALKESQGKDKAEALVNQAILDGKISKSNAEIWTNNAISDYEGTKTLIDSLNVVPGSINDSLESGGDDKTKKTGGAEKDLADRYNKMLVENSKELDQLTDEDEKKMVAAWEKHYGPKLESSTIE